MHRGDAGLAGERIGSIGVVAGEHGNFGDTEVAQFSDRLRGVIAQCVGKKQRAGKFAVNRNGHRGLSRGEGMRTRFGCRLLHKTELADHDGAAIDYRGDAVGGDFMGVVTGGEGETALCCGIDHAGGEHMR